MTLNEQVAQLKVVLPKLKANDQSFAIDLIAAFQKKKSLTPKQEPWVAKLIERAEAPVVVPVAVQVGSFDGVIALFAKAKAHLKYPKITLLCLGKPVTLAVAGAGSKAPGSVNVMGEGKYPDREWFGRVSPDGAWVPSKSMKPEMKDALLALLTKFASQPARVAKEHGKLTGHCCFCNSILTDDKSLAAGFGPVCADHYGLKTEWKLAVAKNGLAAGTEASEVLDTTPIGWEKVETGKCSTCESTQNLFAKDGVVLCEDCEDNAAWKTGCEKFEAALAKPKQMVFCFFCEKPSAETKVMLGYTVCPTCAKQLS